MVHRLAAVLAAVAVTGSPATAANAQTQARAAEDLRPALLTPADLPEGFVPIAAATDDDGAVTLGGNFPGCPSLDPVTGDGTTAAAVTYSKGAVGPYLTDALVHFPAGGAATAMDRLTAAVTTCKSFSQELAGITVRFTLTPAQVPATLGEKAFGVRMTGDTDFGIAVTADIIAVRRGDFVLWLNDMTVGTAGAGLVGTLARTAADRCAQQVKGC
ncbi:hypothetical protein GCM10027610_006570 [Dactylosporangium cerinum]